MVTATNNNPATSLINSLNAANSSVNKSGTTANSASGMQNTFMTLLTTQLQNQDPLNPMDTSQMTSQLAQINTVSGINSLNTTLTSLNNSLTSSQSLSTATGLIGHNVLVPGTSIQLSSGSGVAGVQLAQAADSVNVTIKDAASGNTVKTIHLTGAQQAGVVPVVWDGSTDSGATAADGNYTMTAQAVTGSTTATAPTLSLGTVNAVNPGTAGQNATLNVAGLGTFDLSKISMVM
jgi:flagellar basal-body rod modification protein FlgD